MSALLDGSVAHESHYRYFQADSAISNLARHIIKSNIVYHPNQVLTPWQYHIVTFWGQ